MKITLLFSSISLLALSGCATMPEKSSHFSESSTKNLTINTVKSNQNTSQNTSQTTPMYNLLVAELSVRRGDNATAIDHYLDAIDKIDNAEIAERAVKVAAHAKDLDSALLAVKKWQSFDPDNYKPYQIAGTVLFRQGFIDDAFNQFVISIEKRGATNRLAFTSILSILARERKPEGVLLLSSKIAHKYPEIAYAQFMHGSLAAKFNQSQEAISFLDKALAIEDIGDAHGLRAKLLLKVGRRNDAVESLGKAVENHPNNNELRLTYARLLIDVKQYKKARAEFALLLEKSPHDADLLYTLGLLSLESNLLVDAETHLTKLLKSSKRRGEAIYYLGRINESKKDLNKAVEWYQKVVSGDFEFDAHLRAAKLLARMGKTPEATKELNDLKMTHQSESTLVRIYLTEASIYRGTQHFAEAMTVYNQALNKIPGNNDLLYARAITSEKVGRVDILERDILQILKTEPDNAHALNALGFSLSHIPGRLEDAYKYIKKALSLAPDEAAIIDSMGWIEFKLGHTQKAETLLRKAFSMLEDSEIAAHLGEVLWTLGKQQEAKKIWVNVLKNEPESSFIKEVMQRLIP